VFLVLWFLRWLGRRWGKSGFSTSDSFEVLYYKHGSSIYFDIIRIIIAKENLYYIKGKNEL